MGPQRASSLKVQNFRMSSKKRLEGQRFRYGNPSTHCQWQRRGNSSSFQARSLFTYLIEPAAWDRISKVSISCVLGADELLFFFLLLSCNDREREQNAWVILNNRRNETWNNELFKRHKRGPDRPSPRQCGVLRTAVSKILKRHHEFHGYLSFSASAIRCLSLTHSDAVFACSR